MNPLWSWCLTLVGFVGLLCAGSRKWWGWLILCGNECLWVVYAVTTRQWGFIFGAIVYGLAYTRNIRKWKQT